MVTSRGYRHIFGTFNEFCMHTAELPQDDLVEWCIKQLRERRDFFNPCSKRFIIASLTFAALIFILLKTKLWERRGLYDKTRLPA